MGCLFALIFWAGLELWHVHGAFGIAVGAFVLGQFLNPKD